VSWAWWDWPVAWLTNHRPSVLWHCWLGHLTRKIVSEMTYNVSSGTLNSTIPYHRGCLACFSSLSSKCLCVFVLHGAIYIIIFLLIFFFTLVSWAWWDWPLTWLTNHRPSVLWHCWLDHLTRKIVSKMSVEWDVKLYYTIPTGCILKCLIVYKVSAVWVCHAGFML